MEEFDFEKLSTLLKKSSNIEIKMRVKNFFDVSGYPHYENVVSNILAFFFDVTEEHNLKDLWLKSLLECYNEKAKTNVRLGEFEEIEREHSTEENKRLDIIISLDDTVVAIENKIYAPPSYNPFDEYHKEILDFKKEKKGEAKQEDIKIVEILLSIYEKGDQKIKNYRDAIFYNITYKNFIGKIKKNLGDYVSDANEKWLIFMNEFMKNVENLGERDKMNKEWQIFLKDNNGDIPIFFEKFNNDIINKTEFIKKLERNVKEILQLKGGNLNIGTYNTQRNRESFRGYFSLYIDIPKGNDIIALEPYISRQNPAYLIIELWNRNNINCDWAEELKLLQNEFPKAETVDDGSWGKCLRLETLDFENEISTDELAKKIVTIVEKLQAHYKEQTISD